MVHGLTSTEQLTYQASMFYILETSRAAYRNAKRAQYQIGFRQKAKRLPLKSLISEPYTTLQDDFLELCRSIESGLDHVDDLILNALIIIKIGVI